MSDPCIYCGHDKRLHIEDGFACGAMHCYCQRWADEPTDHEMMNRHGVEGGIGYPPEEALSEHDWRL